MPDCVFSIILNMGYDYVLPPSLLATNVVNIYAYKSVLLDRQHKCFEGLFRTFHIENKL